MASFQYWVASLQLKVPVKNVASCFPFGRIAHRDKKGVCQNQYQIESVYIRVSTFSCVFTNVVGSPIFLLLFTTCEYLESDTSEGSTFPGDRRFDHTPELYVLAVNLSLLSD